MKFFYVIVNYKTDAMLFAYLESVATASGNMPSIDLHVMVIDNSMRSVTEHRKFESEVNSRCTSSEVVFSEMNLGYFGGIQIAQARIKDKNADAVIYSNADLLLATDFFIQLQKESQCNSAVLAPAILSEQGNGFDQNPKHVMRISVQKLRFLRFAYSNLLLFRSYTWLGLLKERMRGKPSNNGQVMNREGRKIYAPHGALFVFSDVNFFLSLPKHEPFLYGEELMVAEEALRKNYEIRYVPNLKVFDLRHGSIGELVTSTKRRFMHESLVFILKNYY